MYYISRTALAHKSERDPEGREEGRLANCISSIHPGIRGPRCYPLRVAFLRISGLLESLDCPSDWFVGVAEEGAMPKNQLEEPD